MSALAGVLISGWWSGRRQRQQMFQRHLEWASELALSSDERTREFGVGQLDALRKSPWYSPRDEALLAAALEEALQPAAGDIDAAGSRTLLVQADEPGDTEDDDIKDGDTDGSQVDG